MDIKGEIIAVLFFRGRNCLFCYVSLKSQPLYLEELGGGGENFPPPERETGLALWWRG